eukprot:737614-Alexandrium_andersonii.AAC.1
MHETAHQSPGTQTKYRPGTGHAVLQRLRWLLLARLGALGVLADPSKVNYPGLRRRKVAGPPKSDTMDSVKPSTIPTHGSPVRGT